MGREIRKVAKDWIHPKDYKGDYIPQNREYYNDVMDEWIKNHNLWLKGEHPDQLDGSTEGLKFYAEWDGNPPDVEYYRTINWTPEQACCFQFYENVSERTPLSPVFEKIEDLQIWLIQNEGYSEETAKRFCESGYAPSFIINNKGVQDGINGLFNN